MKNKKKQKKGFTLIEVLVGLAIFFVLTGSILATFTVAMGYWQHGNAQNDIKEATRLVLQTIASELSQGVIDPDPGAVNTATGYLSINPALASLLPPFNSATAVLKPNGNAAQQTTAILLFTEPNTANYNPTAAGFNAYNPANYRQVQYSVVGGNTLQRSETDYNASGVPTAPSANSVVFIKGGTLTLQFHYDNAYTFDLSVTAQKAGVSYTLTSNMYLPGGVSQ